MNYYEHHLGDYAAATGHLSLLEHGIYLRLMQLYYIREGALPADQVMRLVGARADDERAAVRDVLNEFFTLDGDVYRNARCDAEIERYQSKQRKATASAKARWSHTDGSADAMRTHTERTTDALPAQSEGNALQTPDTSNQTCIKDAVRDKPRKRGSRRVPAAFEPSAELMAWAQDEVPRANVSRELAKFRDHEFAKPHTDWPAAFRNWLRNAHEQAPRVQTGSSPPEPQWRTESRQRMQAFAGRYAAKPTTPQPETIDAAPPLLD